MVVDGELQVASGEGALEALAEHARIARAFGHEPQRLTGEELSWREPHVVADAALLHPQGANLDATLLAPNDAIAWYILGDVQRRLGKHGDAGFSLGKALKLDQGHVETWVSLTELSLALGSLETALAESAQAVALAPGDPGPRMELGALLFRQGEQREAKTQYQACFRLGAPRDVLQTNIAVIDQALGEGNAEKDHR